MFALTDKTPETLLTAESVRGRLPRLLYLADTPVEASAHGSILLYRLLQDYPPKKLRVVETNLQQSQPQRRLPGVVYRSIPLGWERLLHSRFNRFWSPWLSCVARFKVRATENVIRDFDAEAVLTVHFGCAWVTAARLAERRKLPLHLILHDDWNQMGRFPQILRPWLDRQFQQTYMQASSRLCVSPYMQESYRERYGMPGTVLYPSRARDCARYDRPPERLGKPPERFTVAYGGNIFSRGGWDALRETAEALLLLGGRLVIFSPNNREQAAHYGLTSPNIECRGFVKSAEMIQRLREEADVVLIPETFEDANRANMTVHFPSKLADSTVPGVPLLVYGPPWSAAVRWAQANPGVAEVVTRQDVGKLAAALERLRVPSHRLALGKAALQKGNEFFSHAAAERVFLEAVTLWETPPPGNKDLGLNGEVIT
jgi:glycosyltransferase involved in cell wall biosynthesis